MKAVDYGFIPSSFSIISSHRNKQERETAESLVFQDAARGVYKKLVIKDNRIAGGVPVRVVDLLEPVQVQGEDTEHPAEPAGPPERDPQGRGAFADRPASKRLRVGPATRCALFLACRRIRRRDARDSLRNPG